MRTTKTSFLKWLGWLVYNTYMVVTILDFNITTQFLIRTFFYVWLQSHSKMEASTLLIVEVTQHTMFTFMYKYGSCHLGFSCGSPIFDGNVSYTLMEGHNKMEFDTLLNFSSSQDNWTHLGAAVSDLYLQTQLLIRTIFLCFDTSTRKYGSQNLTLCQVIILTPCTVRQRILLILHLRSATRDKKQDQTTLQRLTHWNSNTTTQKETSYTS